MHRWYPQCMLNAIRCGMPDCEGDGIPKSSHLYIAIRKRGITESQQFCLGGAGRLGKMDGNARKWPEFAVRNENQVCKEAIK